MIWSWGKRWMLVAIGIPVLAWALDRAADTVEQRKGRSDVTAGMRGVAGRIRELREGRGRRGTRRRRRTA